MSINILAIDISIDKFSVALFNDNKIHCLNSASKNNFSKNKHCILELIDYLLKINNIKLNNINLLAYNQGPGSFTSIRNVICIIQGLSFGANLPALGISTLVMLAQKAWRLTNSSNILVAIDAKMNKMYWGEYFRNSKGLWIKKNYENLITYQKAISKIVTLSGQWTTAGNAWKGLYQLLKRKNKIVNIKNSEVSLSSAKDIIPLVLKTNQSKYIFLPEKNKPIYLHNLKLNT